MFPRQLRRNWQQSPAGYQKRSFNQDHMQKGTRHLV